MYIAKKLATLSDDFGYLNTALSALRACQGRNHTLNKIKKTTRDLYEIYRYQLNKKRVEMRKKFSEIYMLNKKDIPIPKIAKKVGLSVGDVSEELMRIYYQVPSFYWSSHDKVLSKVQVDKQGTWAYAPLVNLSDMSKQQKKLLYQEVYKINNLEAYSTGRIKGVTVKELKKQG